MEGTPQLPLEKTGSQQALPDLNFNHLQIELLRIDFLVHNATRQCLQAYQKREMQDTLLDQYISAEEVLALLKQPLGARWWQLSDASDEPENLFAGFQQQVQERAQILRERAREQGQVLRLDHLASVFGLNAFEMDIFLLALAPALDRRYEKFYGFLQNNALRKWPSINLILDLLCEPAPERLLNMSYFSDQAPLLRHNLLTLVKETGMEELALLNQALAVEKPVVAWLLGNYTPPARLGTKARLLMAEDSPADQMLVGDSLPALLATKITTDSLFAFYGDDDLRQEAAARQLAAHSAYPLLMVDLYHVVDTTSPPLQSLRVALRDALLNSAILYLSGWDVFFKEGVAHPEAQELVLDFCGPRIITGKDKWQFWRMHHGGQIKWSNFSAPAYQHRSDLWRHYLAGQATLDHLSLADLAGQFSLTSKQILNTVLSAQDLAAQKGEALNYTHLFTTAREYSSPYLIKFAKKLTPRYHWEDIILQEDQLSMLQEMVGMVRKRPMVLDEWDVRQKLVSSSGITALFSGPPGTGKTMSAEVIALELGLDLYKINLASVVSKYIGETEKNLEQVFNEAGKSNAILFFDEADALFGKRSEVRDAHDRYANIEISYLLQQIETYDGVTILATNLQANLDEAFTRRIHFIVKFSFPEKQERVRIWQALFPASLPRQKGIDFMALAYEFKLSGGSIRNAIVSAAYLAANDGGEITLDHLYHGIRRELQKMGRFFE